MTATTVAPPIYRTSIGKKVLMAVTGVYLVLWVIGHMLGNLKVWLSPKEINSYSEFLRRMGDPIFPHTWLLWIIRILLIVALVVHVYLAIDLSVRSRGGRQVHPHPPENTPADLPVVPAVTMRWGGVAVGLFIVFHLAHLTWGWIHPGYKYVRGDVYQNVVGSFNQWWLVVLYVAAMFALAMHLYHGTWSMFQTFGTNNRHWDPIVRRTATAIAIIVFLGFISVPLGVLGGVIS
jgi:succinate dehydrogenase / fumarate reductase, cytochrome b subunit